VGVPFALATLTGQFSQAAMTSFVGGLVLIPIVAFLLTQFPAPKQPQGFPIADAGGLVKDPLLLLMGMMLFLESGLEITVGGWTSTFVHEVLQVTPGRALVVLSLYWLGMMLARIALGTILREASHFAVLYVCIAIGLAGSALLLTSSSVTAAAIGVFLLGVGFAAMFPTVLGFIGDRYSTLSGTAFSLVIAMALIGGMLLPYVAGVLGASVGMRRSFVLVPVALVMLGLLLGVLSRKLHRA